MRRVSAVCSARANWRPMRSALRRNGILIGVIEQLLLHNYPQSDLVEAVLFVIILPFLGVFIYLIARGGKMHERAAQQAALQQKAFDQYVKQAAGTPGESSADQLHKLADLKSQGVLTDAEFEAQKAKILAS